MNASGTGRVRFGNYELHADAGRLFRDGRPVKIQPQPLRVLSVLVERPGEIVTREELRLRIWGEATFVEFDKGLNYCIHQIRAALRDDASQPAYVETLPKQGYRFIAPVTGDAAFDVAADLPATATVSASGFESVSPRDFETAGNPPARKRYLWQIAATVTLLATVIWLTMAARESPLRYPLRVTQVSKLTSYAGDEREPAISPNGQFVAFSWSGEGRDNYDIYVTQDGGQQPLRLTRDPAPDSFPAWSPDSSQIAFVRHKGTVADIVLVPVLGGEERTLHQFSRTGPDLDFSQHPALTWIPDGKSIVYSGQPTAAGKYQLNLLSVDTGAVRALSSAGGEFIGDSSPALSADGKWMAFVRYLAVRNGRLLIQPMDPGIVPKGEPATATQSGLAVRSPVWLEDGKQLLFADAGHTFQWERNQGTISIYAADGALGGLSLGPWRRDHARQVVVAIEKQDPDIYAIPLNAGGTRSIGPPQVIQRSTTTDGHPDISPDGRHLVFNSDRSGSEEIWEADADGGNPRQLTHLGAHIASYAHWSPDGTQIVFHARVPDVSELYLIDVSEGVTRQITHEKPGLGVATWSKDGRSIYASTLVSGAAISYRIPVGGGPIERLWVGDLFHETADGKYIVYSKTNAPGIFRRSLAGDPSKNREEQIVADFWRTNQIGGYAAVPGGIYYVSVNAQGRPGPFRYFDFASRQSTDVAPAVPGLGRGFAISPDRRRMFYSASAEVGGDLLSLELR